MVGGRCHRAHRVRADEQSAGRWEWVGLPDFGISCMRAELAPDLLHSQLAADGVEWVGRLGAFCFKIYPIAEDGRTFVLAEAPTSGPVRGSGAARPRITTSCILADHLWSVKLDLMPRREGVVPLILGQDALQGLKVDLDAEYLMGIPWIGGCSSGNRGEE